MLIFFKIIIVVAIFMLFVFWVVSSRNYLKSQTVVMPQPHQEEDKASDFDGNVTAKRILTDSEAFNFDRLIDHLPDGVIFCPQVNFSAFIKCDKMALRNRFNRKMCDGLLVDLDYNPLLIVEIDDDSHTSKKVKLRDLQRDEIAAAAGIPTLRITNSTPTEMLNKLIVELISKAA